MRIHNHQAETFIVALAESVNKDPSSLENWLCLHVPHHDNTNYEHIETALAQIKDSHKDIDCDIIHCADNDVLLISRCLKADGLYNLAHELLATDAKPDQAHIYDLFYDWRMVRDLLLAKTHTHLTAQASCSMRQFDDESFLHDVFLEAKALRKGRTQLHMMVVEDDPVTRRIVCSAFKQYALITATTAQEAISNYLLHAPDIVFLDIGLPDASGLDVLRRIIANDADAYVVMFSSNSYLDNVTAALVNGASGFVAKPFKKDKMHYYIMDSALHHAKLHA